ncbi:MAG: RHS repeat-associated core domain-containing protein [Phycisphaerae bacterium]
MKSKYFRYWPRLLAGPPQNEKTVIYLTDSYNHTGYSQALEELTFNKAAPDLQTDTPDSVRTYLLGDDVIAQTVNGTTQYLLYDGHGSTRQLTDESGSLVPEQTFSYDGYGVMVGYTGTPQTNLLYCGEYLDPQLRLYNLRARDYDPFNGRFYQLDPYAGNLHDPQSLHKYLYCHANPINGIDPSGEFSVGFTIGVAVIGIMAAIWAPTIVGMYSNRSWHKKQISERPELYRRNVNKYGIWAGWVGSGSVSFLFARMNGVEGKIYNIRDSSINTKISVLGAGFGFGAGVSVGGGAILIFNAHTLEDITKIGYWDPEISFDFLDPIPESSAIKILKRTGLHTEDIVKLVKYIRLKQLEKINDSINRISTAFDLAGGKPTALLLNPEGGLQFYLGLSYNEVLVQDPSFE